ncbi:MAG: PspC domain-containing protein [Chitinivibrionia bacterium]|nr:PspC domain-containing protein [Chitinivibrionia bacterium]
MKRLYRSEKDTKIFGICGGVAEYFGIDPTVVRIAVLVAAVLSGFVPFTIGYFIAYLIIPVNTSSAEEVK